MQFTSPCNLSQRLFDELMRIPNKDLINRIKFQFLSKCRNLFIRLDNPLIHYNLDGTKISLPLSHDLPFNRKTFPQYSANVARIARHVVEKYDNMTFVDIGANIGDTVAILRNPAHFPILCIEGDEHFFNILKMNVTHLQDVEIENIFVGNFTGLFTGNIERMKGTARLVQNSSESHKFNMQTLTDILKRHPRFFNSKMIKADTDGFDCLILKSESELLSRIKPVLFFEYDPYLFGLYNDDGYKIFESLQSIGYQFALFYENNGDYLLGTDIGNTALIEDIHQFYSDRMGKRYCDVCVFHKEDSDLWEKVRLSEIQFFRNFRGALSKDI